MLIRFSVENFMSFNTMESFSMAASKVTRMKNHIKIINDKRILKGGLIFGANASGKTNFIKAIEFASKVILNGSESMDFSKKHFRINKGNFSLPGVFQFDFILNENSYSYGFAISYINKEIVSEWLYKIGSNEVCIFERGVDFNGNVNISSDINLKKINNDDAKKFEVYKDDYINSNNKKIKQNLFISDIASRSSEKSEFFGLFIDIINWFKNIIIIFPNSKYIGLAKIVENTNLKEVFESLLAYFDTGVKSVEEYITDFDQALSNIKNSVIEKIKADVSNELNDKPLTVKVGKSIITLNRNDEGDITTTKMVLNHGNEDDLFDCEDESDGTQRLFDLIPLFLHALNEKVIFIDEIDRSLHTKLTEAFIKLFYEVSEDKETQLIATTHDTNLLDLDLVRQDEIWFVERQIDNSSKIYSLNKFNERFDKKVEKDYLLGRYGAVPIFTRRDDFVFEEE